MHHHPTNRIPSAAATLLLAIALLSARTARAQSASDRTSAREAFRSASEQHDAGNDVQALAQYKAAYALAPTPEYGLALAECYRSLDKLAEAREVALGVAELPKSDPSPRAANARDDAAALAASLEPRIPSLQVKIAGDPDGATLTVNNKPMSVDALAAPLRLNPGDYTFVLKAADGSVATRKVSLREGESRKLRLDPRASDGTDERGAPPAKAVPSDEGAAARAKDPTRPPQNAITTALLDPIFNGELNVEYERAVVPALSVYVAPSVLVWNGLFNANNSAGYSISGWGLDGGLRVYPFAGRPGGGATRGAWISADVRYATLSLTGKSDPSVTASGSDVRVGSLVGYSFGPAPLVLSFGIGGAYDTSQATAHSTSTGKTVTLGSSGLVLLTRFNLGVSF